VLTRLLDEGQAALDAGNGNLAQQKFATALMIDSTSQVARRGRKRARTIDAVIALIASGNQHEADGDLPLAADDYQEALGLDPYSPEARHALENVTGRIREAQFQLLLSEGMAAFNNHEYPAALKKLISAKALRPNSPEVREALLQVDQALRLARIAELQNQALAAEQREDWQVALKSYQAVLDIDRNVQFAGHGKNRAVEQIRIAKRLDFFLAKPDTLESDSQLKNAIRLIREAGDVEPRGPKLAARINQLERLVNIAKTPVKITIESDNLTQVAVYRVGKLGRFEVHELELRPGTYTVVGARDGYQDVRQKIVVKPGRQPIRVTIKCKVKI
jgi:tetratricopeptide (TPR) repeat protein